MGIDGSHGDSYDQERNEIWNFAANVSATRRQILIQCKKRHLDFLCSTRKHFNPGNNSLLGQWYHLLLGSGGDKMTSSGIASDYTTWVSRSLFVHIIYLIILLFLPNIPISSVSVEFCSWPNLSWSTRGISWTMCSY
jgi:hypothetical protein